MPGITSFKEGVLSLTPSLSHSLTNKTFTFDLKEQSQRLVTFETFDQSDEGTWPDQQKDNEKYEDKDKDNDKDNYI